MYQETRKSRAILSKYEKTAILGTRTEQLARGAEPYVPIKLPFDPREVAMEEIRQKKLPFKIARSMPDGTREVWTLDELEWGEF